MLFEFHLILGTILLGARANIWLDTLPDRGWLSED